MFPGRKPDTIRLICEKSFGVNKIFGGEAMAVLFGVNSVLFLVAMAIAYWYVRQVDRENQELRNRNYRLGIQSQLFRDRLARSEDRIESLRTAGVLVRRR